jgi:hypothetical protein
MSVEGQARLCILRRHLTLVKDPPVTLTTIRANCCKQIRSMVRTDIMLTNSSVILLLLGVLGQISAKRTAHFCQHIMVDYRKVSMLLFMTSCEYNYNTL